jgi:4-carboxymuconolactone decarboxylase
MYPRGMITTNDPSRFERGFAKLQEVDGDAGQRVIDALSGVAPDLARYVIEFPFGDIYQRPGLDLRMRELITVASLTTQGTIPQLKVHIHGALNVGCSEMKVVDTIIQDGSVRRICICTQWRIRPERGSRRTALSESVSAELSG